MGANFGLGWRQVACCFVLLATDAVIAASYSILAVPLGREFHPSRMVLMLAMTILAGVSGLISPFLGALMDRVPMRRMMIAGSLLLGGGYAALSLATSFSHVLIVFGLLIAPANVLLGPVATTVLISRWFVARRGRAIGIAVAGLAVSSVIFPPVVQGLLDRHDWRVAMQLFGLLLLVLTLPAAALVVDSPEARGLHPDGATGPAIAAARRDDGAGSRVSAGVILADPAFWIAAGIFAAVLAGTKGMVTNLAPMAVDRGIRPHDAALLISVYGVCGLAAKLSFAAIADRMAPRVLLFVSIVAFTAGMACLAVGAGGYAAMALGVGLIGIGGGLMTPLQSLLVPRIFGQRIVGRAMGLISMVLLVALLSTPPLFGWIYDVTGSYSAIFLAFAALAIAALVAVPYMRLQPPAARTPLPPAEALAPVA